MQLTSPKNPLIQKIHRAAATGRPTEDGLIVIEGPHLLEEAIRGEWQIAQVFASPGAHHRYSHLLRRTDAEVFEVSQRAFTSVATTESPRDVLAVVRPRAWTWTDLLGQSALVIALDGIQDPGNAGTIVRSAEAFGATGLVFLKGCARVSNGKLLRASAGSIFRIPFLEAVTTRDFITQVQRGNLPIYALAAQGNASLDEADLRSPCALAVGGEGAGLSAELLGAAQAISIPTAHVESLNAAIACSIALFEAHRRRNGR